jgi:hypothetical protein
MHRTLSFSVYLLSQLSARIFYKYDSKFVCFKPHEQFFSYLAAVTITGDRAANLGLCSALWAFEQGGIFNMPHLLGVCTIV